MFVACIVSLPVKFSGTSVVAVMFSVFRVVEVDAALLVADILKVEVLAFSVGGILCSDVELVFIEDVSVFKPDKC